jgi:hypothetical protein
LSNKGRCHRRLKEWQEGGVREGIGRAFLSSLDEAGRLDWDRVSLDGAFVPAKRGERVGLTGRVERAEDDAGGAKARASCGGSWWRVPRGAR